MGQLFFEIPLRTDASGNVLERIPIRGSAAIDRIRVTVAAGQASLVLTVEDPKWGDVYVTKTGAGVANADLETAVGTRFPVVSDRDLIIRGVSGDADEEAGTVLIQLVGD